MSVNVHARPRSGLSLDWLTGYSELLRTLLRRELRSRYKASALGIAWSLVYPLSMMGVYTLVFSVLWRAVSVPHYPLFVLSGLATWVFFQAALQLSATSLHANSNLIKKVWFPRELVPVAVVLSQAVAALIMFVVLIPIDLFVVPETHRTFVLFFPIFAALLCLVFGFSWIIATANVFFRDVEHLVGVLFLPWFFLTPVLYGLDQLPAAANHVWLIKLLRYGNPITPYVEGIRGVTLQGQVPGPSLLAYIFVVGPLVAVLGLAVIQRYEDRFAVEL